MKLREIKEIRLFKKGDIVKDVYGKTHEVTADQKHGSVQVFTDDLEYLHPTKLKLVKSINEDKVDINVLLSLKNIIKNGKISDYFQYVILFKILQALKNGNIGATSNTFLSNLNDRANDELQTVVIDSIKSLSPSQQATLAQELYLIISQRESVYFQSLSTMDTCDWIRYITQKEAND